MANQANILCRISIFLLVSLNPVFGYGQEPIPSPGCMDLGDGRTYPPSMFYNFDHPCSECENQTLGHCKALNRVVAPKYSAAQDLVIIPHRGVWGFPKGAGLPENTLGAVKCAKQYGLNVIEVDVMKTLDGKAVLSHYFPLTWADRPGDLPDKTLAELMTYRVKMRNGELHPTETYGDFAAAAEYAWAEGALLVVDIKVRQGGSTPEGMTAFVSTVKAVLESVSSNHLGSIAIKVPAMDYHPFMAEIYSQIPNYVIEYKDKFQWIPISSKALAHSDLSSVLTRLNIWMSNEGKNLAFVETIIFSPDWWGAKPFIWFGIQYEGLVDYVRRFLTSSVRPYGYRASVWSLDSMGERGTFTREYEWRHYGNFADDKRGVIPITMNFDGMTHSMITTDRFDIFQQYLDSNWHGTQPNHGIREITCSLSN